MRLAISTTLEDGIPTAEHKKCNNELCECQSCTVMPDYFHVSVETAKCKIIRATEGGGKKLAESKLVRTERGRGGADGFCGPSVLEWEGRSTVLESIMAADLQMCVKVGLVGKILVTNVMYSHKVAWCHYCKHKVERWRQKSHQM